MQREIIYEKDNVQIIKVTDHVYFRYITHTPMGEALGNGAYIFFDGKLYAVDAPSEKHFHLMQDEVKELFSRQIDTLLISHPHIDHIEGLPEVARAGIPIIAHRTAAEWLGQNEAFRKNMTGVEGKLRLRNGDEVLELLTYPGFNHSRGDLFITLPNESIMLTGDSVVLPRSIYISDGDFENWYGVLGQLSQLPYKTLLPGHGEINTPDIYKKVLDYFCDLRLAVRYQLERMAPDEIAIDTHEHAKQVAETVLTDPDNIWGARLVPQGLERKVREHIIDVYRLYTGRRQFPRYHMVVPE